MRLIFLLLFIGAPYYSYAEEGRVVPEMVLNSWGYKTTEIDTLQRIKSIKKADLPNYERIYYPRFSISKTCFASDLEAEKENQLRIERIKSSFGGGFKTYRSTLIERGCLYEVYADAELFYLEFQPELVSNLAEYVSEN